MRAPVQVLLGGSCLAAGLVAVASLAAAQPPADAPPPSLALASDTPPPLPTWSLALDPLGIAFGQYGVQLAVALAPAHVLSVAPGWDKGGGPGVEVGYELFFLGQGLSGPFLGPVAGVVLGSRSHVSAATLGAEAGYQHVWSGLLVGGAVGGQMRWREPFGRQARARLELRVRIALGWAWD